ncbi:MAG: tRNA wybutosine-synthesizing 3 family protein [Candidatus Pacearchaeota archaeon]
MRDNFTFRKKNQLKKFDKSIKGNWDEKIIELCKKINTLDNYYTTSSCSGRILLIKKSSEKKDNLFIKVWHNNIDFKNLKEELKKINSNELIYFKQDPVIVHVGCRDLKDAQGFIDIAVKKAGWKRCGILSFGKRIIVELNSTEKLEFPIFYNKILVDDNFLKLITKEANLKLKLGWSKIERLIKLL